MATSTTEYSRAPRGRLCESDTLISVVEDGVEASDEDVAEDPERAVRSGDVDAHEAREAHGHAFGGHLQRIDVGVVRMV